MEKQKEPIIQDDGVIPPGLSFAQKNDLGGSLKYNQGDDAYISNLDDNCKSSVEVFIE